MRHLRLDPVKLTTSGRERKTLRYLKNRCAATSLLAAVSRRGGQIRSTAGRT